MSLELQKMNEGIVSMDTHRKKPFLKETNREIIPKKSWNQFIAIARK